MATNPYVNKVQKADGSVIIDISDTTAVASDVASGKDFYLASGEKVTGTASGGSSAISVVDTTDSHGGTVRTITALDISDTTAVASDVASGKYFYTADGTKTAGTASGGGGGLEYETGTWTPSEDVATYVISFANTHTEPPFFYIVSDATGTYSSATNTGYETLFVDWGHLFGVPMYEEESTPKYSEYRSRYKGSSDSFGGGGAMIGFPYTETTSQSSVYPRYFATETGIRAYASSNSRYWRAGRTYKWIAVWAPTT